MRWKKLLIAAAVLLVVLITAFYSLLAFYDFNKLKPLITRTVSDAIGRELILAGNISVKMGLHPTLVVEDAGLQNASWGSKPQLIHVKRMEVQVVFLPLLIGKLDFLHLLLVEPEVLVEFNRTGTCNFIFDDDSADTESDSTEIPPPPLIFSQVQIENGRFFYNDMQENIKFSIAIDRLEAQIPGFAKSLHLEFKGAFNDMPFALKGTAGPIWAWVEPGYPLPADLTLTAAGATAHIIGEMSDPYNLEKLAFAVSAEGPSVAAVAQLAGVQGVPELGTFKLKGQVSDPDGNLGIEQLELNAGTPDKAAIAMTGSIRDLIAGQELDLHFTIRADSAANLLEFKSPPPPLRKPFQLTGTLSDPKVGMYSISDLEIALGSDKINGRVDLNVGAAGDRLKADLSSKHFVLGPLKLAASLARSAKKIALRKIDLQLGSEKLARINLNGGVKDLIGLQGINLNFSARSRDVARLKKITGQPLPVRGFFSVAGKFIAPLHNRFKISNLQLAAGKSRVDGSVELNLTGKKPRFSAVLSTRGLNLQPVLIPELAKQQWVKPLGAIGPVKLAVNLSGFADELALPKVDLQAGTRDSVAIRVKGSIENLSAQRGLDLNIFIAGNDFARMKQIAGQSYFLAPIPITGTYAISADFKGASVKKFKADNLKMALGKNEMTGWVDVDLEIPSPQITAHISADHFNLRSLRFPGESFLRHLAQIEDLGPLDLKSKVIIMTDHIALKQLDLKAGSDRLAAVQVKGAIDNLTLQQGLDLTFEIHGSQVASLEKITGHPLPLRGAYALSGKLTDPAIKHYRVSGLALELGENNLSGRLDLNLAAGQRKLTAQLSAPKFTLQPVTLAAVQQLAGIKDLGPLKLTADLTDSGKKIALQNLDFQLGTQQHAAMTLKGTIADLTDMKEVQLEFSLRGDDFAVLQKMGGPDLPLKGPFYILGRFTNPQPGIYKIPALTVKLGQSDVKGSLELNVSGQRPRVIADLSSQKLDLRPVLKTDDKKKTAEGKLGKTAQKSDKVFSAEPFQLQELKRVDADIKIRNQQVLLPQLALNDVTIDLKLENGNLTVRPINMTVGGGSAGGWLTLQTRQEAAAIDMDLKAEKVDLGAMFDELGARKMLSGKLDAELNLSARGNSVAAMMAGLNGHFSFVQGKGKIAKSYMDLISMSLGGAFRQLLNPFEAKKDYTVRNCTVARAKITDGLAEVALLLDTEQTVLVSAGEIDLKKETLSISIKPHPKKGFGIEGVASVNVSLSELSKPFKLGGTLADPQLAIDPTRSLITLGKIGAVVLFGPIGLAAFLGDISIGNENTCAKAIEAAKRKIPEDKKTDKRKKQTKEKKKE